jgi:AIPR protein
LPSDVHIKFEIIVTKDDDLIAETSIARNFQNDVMNISIAGRRGQFDELEQSFQKTLPNNKLRKSETELPTNETVDTEKLLQIITALVPPQLWYRTGEDNNPNKVYTYSMKARCLKEFQEIFIRAKNSEDEEHEKYKALYNFYLDISADAWQLYTKWKSHQGFKGTRLVNGITRDSNGDITDVADGIVFPILSSFSVFVKKTRAGWKINPPSFFSDDELIKTAKTALIEIAFHNPWNMGKSKACYSALLQITSLYKKLESRDK